jgi:hypothetical protein
MAKAKEKIVDVKLTDGEEDTKVKIVVKRPTSNLMSRAQRVSAKAWTDCVRDGIMTKKELAKFMREQGIWSKDKDQEQEAITSEIVNLEKKLYVNGSKGSHKLTTSEAKEIAIQMRRKRAELRELIGERLALEANTSEALSDNAKFDFLVANSTYYEDGELVYKSLDDYQAESDGEIAFAAASALAEIMYSIDKDFESNLPENKFLKKFNFVNDDLALVNESGETVDLEGRRINEFGYYINSKGKRTDRDGNELDEDGNYIPSVTYVDDSGKTVSEKPKAKKTVTKRTKATTTDS